MMPSLSASSLPVPSLPAATEVVIIGSGPAGLSCATALAEAGVKNVVVLERDSEAGGAPRHCGHYPFGIREYYRLLKGPDYAKLMVIKAQQAGVVIYVEHTVVNLYQGGRILVSQPQGTSEIEAKHIVIATGNRETPRSARLIGGDRPPGVLNTGSLQAWVYLNNRRPFRRPVILGSELVSFSTLLTCRHAGIKPVGMIEPDSRVTAWKLTSLATRFYGVKLYLGQKVKWIHGSEKVTSVDIEDSSGRLSNIECDGVIVTGKFLPEATLVRSSHLDFDSRTGGAYVNQYSQCSDPVYYSVGNATRSVETARWCWVEGRRLAKTIIAAIADTRVIANVRAEEATDKHKDNETYLELSVKDPIKFVIPQRVALGNDGIGSCPSTTDKFQLRFNRRVNGDLQLEADGQRIWSKKMRCLPERRYLVTLPENILKTSYKSLSLVFEEARGSGNQSRVS